MVSFNEMRGLIKFAGRPPWNERLERAISVHWDVALGKFNVARDELEENFAPAVYAALWSCMFEDMMSQDFPAAPFNLVDDYLKRRGWNEKILHKNHFKAVRDSRMSLYEVKAVVPGLSVTVIDLLRGGVPIVVANHFASKNVIVNDRIGARVIVANGRTLFSGGILLLSDATAADVQRIFAEEYATLDNGAGADFLLKSMAPVFSSGWLQSQLADNPDADGVVLQNSDGEDIAVHVLTFPFAKGATPEQIAARLDALPQLRIAANNFWEWMPDDAGAADRPRAGPVLSGEVILGQIGFVKKTLVLTVNSFERSERGEQLIGAALARLVGKPEIIDLPRDDTMLDDLDDPIVPFDIPITDSVEMIEALLATDYDALLDQPDESLNFQTPRQAAKTAKGRKPVAGWLQAMEDRYDADFGGGEPGDSYDFGWIWEELGVADLRR